MKPNPFASLNHFTLPVVRIPDSGKEHLSRERNAPSPDSCDTHGTAQTPRARSRSRPDGYSVRAAHNKRGRPAEQYQAGSTVRLRDVGGPIWAPSRRRGQGSSTLTPLTK